MANVIFFPKRDEDESAKTAGNTGWVLDFTFYRGVALAFVLPQAILYSYFGTLTAAAFGICALAGISLGVVLYRNFPYTPPSCIPSVFSRTSSEEFTLRLAA